MIKINEGLEYAKVFLDNTKVLERNIFKMYLEELDKILTRMKEAELQIDIRKKQIVKEVKYLEYSTTAEEHSLDPKKIQRILQIEVLQNKR